TIYHYIECQLQFIRLVSFSETLVNGSTVSHRIPATYFNSSFFIIFNCSSTSSSSFLPIRRWPAPSLLQVLLDESADEDDFPSVNDDVRIDAILAETRLLLEATYMLRAMQGTNATKKIFFHVTSAVLS
ncbi:hypothetical protein PENTCL1PPCAC_12571, partial [Pristionchus entomophagus]